MNIKKHTHICPSDAKFPLPPFARSRSPFPASEFRRLITLSRRSSQGDIRTLKAKVDDLLINPNPQHSQPKSDVDLPLPLPSGQISPSPRRLPLAARTSASYKEGGGRGAGADKGGGVNGGGGGGGGGGGDGGGDGCKDGEACIANGGGVKAVLSLGLARGVAKSTCRNNSYGAAARSSDLSLAAASTDATNRQSPETRQGQERHQRGHQGKKRSATVASTPTASTLPTAAAVVAAVVTGGFPRDHKRLRIGERKPTAASIPDEALSGKASSAKANSGLVKFDQADILVGLDQETMGVVASVAPFMQRQVTALPPPLCSKDVARLAIDSVGVVGENAGARGIIRTAIAMSGNSRGRGNIGSEGAGILQKASESAESVGVDWAVGQEESAWPAVECANWTPLMTTQNIVAGSLQESSVKLHMRGGGTGPVGSKANSFTSETTADLSGADEESPLPFFAPDQPARVNWGGEAMRDAGCDAVGNAGHESAGVTEGRAEGLGLDDFGLESPLMLDITAACNSGSGSTSSSWLPLSVGSYLNTEEAFTAFAVSPCEFVPGGW